MTRPVHDSVKRPVIWTIAGSDSSGGAGIQADLKTIQALGGHGCSLLTALTAQNTRSVREVQNVTSAFFHAQWDALWDDLKPSAIKIGMLGSLEIAQALTERLSTIGRQIPVVLDPVLVASSGTSLAEPRVVDWLRDRLIPLATVVTPNLPEARMLIEKPISNREALLEALAVFVKRGAQSIVIKGGHDDGPRSTDYWASAVSSLQIDSPKLAIDAHGTGCTLSSAIATGLGRGLTIEDALVLAKTFVTKSLRQAQAYGSGLALLDFSSLYGGHALIAEDFPEAAPIRRSPIPDLQFARMPDPPMGLYPIVDSIDWIRRLADCGVTTLQLRIKNTAGLDAIVKEAIALARSRDLRLFINDHWQLAIRHRGFGVHLGQEDLAHADLPAIARSGLRLGVSTHCYSEMGIAKCLNPSYVAIGPVYPTTLKVMRHAPLGPETLKAWRRHFRCPVVAIGGITLERARSILPDGADSISVVSDIVGSDQPEARARQWVSLFRDSTH